MGKQKESELNELFECFMDWKKEKIIKEWKCIYTKHQKANKLYAMMLKRRMFKAYIDCIYFSKIETQKDQKFADEHFVNALRKKSFCFWLKIYEKISQKNEYLEAKYRKFWMHKRRKMMRLRFKNWLKTFHQQVNDRKSIQISAQYHEQYVVSKIFVEWKLCVKTRKYKCKLMTKSLSSLRQSVIKNGGFGTNKLSMSQQYIRLSHNSQIFDNKEFAQYLKIKSNDTSLNESGMRMRELDDDDDDDDEYNEFDSVLLRTPGFDNYND